MRHAPYIPRRVIPGETQRPQGLSSRRVAADAGAGRGAGCVRRFVARKTHRVLDPVCAGRLLLLPSLPCITFRRSESFEGHRRRAWWHS